MTNEEVLTVIVKRFDKIDARLDKIDTRLDNIEKNLKITREGVTRSLIEVTSRSEQSI